MSGLQKAAIWLCQPRGLQTGTTEIVHLHVPCIRYFACSRILEIPPSLWISPHPIWYQDTEGGLKSLIDHQESWSRTTRPILLAWLPFSSVAWACPGESRSAECTSEPSLWAHFNNKSVYSCSSSLLWSLRWHNTDSTCFRWNMLHMTPAPTQNVD